MATPKWFANGLLAIANGSVDLDTDTIKFILIASTAPTQATDNFRDDLGTEASGGSGYTAGGFTLASKALSIASLTLKWDAADISQAITGGPFAFRYGAWYKSRGGASSADELIGFVDFGAQSITDATLNITNTDQLQLTAS